MAPASSPDGSQLAFMSNNNGNWEIYATTTHPPGGQQVPEPRRLTKNGARDGLPTWSPDGRWLAFVSDRDGAWAVYVMRPDGSGQQVETTESETDQGHANDAADTLVRVTQAESER